MAEQILDVVSSAEIEELFKMKRNFYYIFKPEFIAECFLNAVDSIAFIDFTSNRKRTSLKVNPFTVNLKFSQEKFLKMNTEADWDYTKCSDLQALYSKITMVIGRTLVAKFTENLKTGLELPEIEEAMKNYRLDKSSVGVILTTISAIVPAQIENFQDDFIFKYSILI